MVEDKANSWEVTKAEYDTANSQFIAYSGLRRQDMAFVTTVQAAVLTIIGTKLLALDATGFLLSGIAFFVLLMGFNSERRLSEYMTGNSKRVNEIENYYHMKRSEYVKGKLGKHSLSNSKTFPIYYSIFIGLWIFIWVLNLRRRLG